MRRYVYFSAPIPSQASTKLTIGHSRNPVSNADSRLFLSIRVVGRMGAFAMCFHPSHATRLGVAFFDPPPPRRSAMHGDFRPPVRSSARLPLPLFIHLCDVRQPGTRKRHSARAFSTPSSPRVPRACYCQSTLHTPTPSPLAYS